MDLDELGARLRATLERREEARAELDRVLDALDDDDPATDVKQLSEMTRYVIRQDASTMTLLHDVISYLAFVAGRPMDGGFPALRLVRDDE